MFWDKQNVEDFNLGMVIDKTEFSHYNYYGQQVHKSRFMIMKGITPPSFIRPRLRGWGLSIVETLIRSINQYLKANDLVFEVLDEFKVDVYKIKNLTNTLLTPDGTNQVQKRIALANQQKSYQNAVTMDSEDDWDHKQLSFAGLAEVMTGIRMQIASDMRMPLTKVFGISAAGFSSGEDDIENYNSMVESQIRAKSKYDILRIIELLCQQMFGYVPEDLQVEFQPLRVLSSEQEENVKTQKFNRLMQAKAAGSISEQEFKEACNKDKLLPIQLDPSVDTLAVEVQEGDDEAEPGAAKETAKKSSTAPKEAKEAKT